MSKIKMQGNASGTGTQTLQSANTSNNPTITLPDVSSTDTLVAAAFAQTLTNKTISGSSNTITGPDGSTTIGYLTAPQSTNTTAAATDSGKHIYITGGSTATFTMITDATYGGSGWPRGTVILVVNNNSGNLTISGAGVTFQLANGTTGNRTVATKGMATLLNVAADTWYVSGAGVT